MPRDLIITLVEWMGIIAVTMILAISPAFQRRRPVKFVYPRREVLVSLGLVALSAVILVVMFSLIPFAPACCMDCEPL